MIPSASTHTSHQEHTYDFSYPKGMLDETLPRPISRLLETLRDVETRAFNRSYDLQLDCLDILEEQLLDLGSDLEARSHLKRAIQLLMSHDTAGLTHEDKPAEESEPFTQTTIRAL